MKNTNLAEKIMVFLFCMGVLTFIFAFWWSITFQGIQPESKEFVNMMVAVTMTTMSGIVGYMVGKNQNKDDVKTDDTTDPGKDS